MITERFSVRAVGRMTDSRGRIYDVLHVVGDGRSRRIVLQRSALASARRFRNRLLSLGVILPVEGRGATDLVAALCSREGVEPTASICDQLGWAATGGGELAFVLDEGFVDAEGWHDVLEFDGGPLPRDTADPTVASVVSDAALWQPILSGSAWEGYDKPPAAPLLTGWRPEGDWAVWKSWFEQAPRIMRTVVSAVLAPVALHGVADATLKPIVISLVAPRGALAWLHGAVSPWAGPRAGLFWPDARLQDLELHAARMGHLPLVFQEADATARAKVFDLVGQFTVGSTKMRASGATGLLPTRDLLGTLVLESMRPLMTPESGMQDSTLQFAGLPSTATPPSFGLAGPNLVQAAIRRSAADRAALTTEFNQLRDEFRRRREALGFGESRTWRLDASHAAVELTHRILVREFTMSGSFAGSDGMSTEWREPMMAAGEAEARRPKPG